MNRLAYLNFDAIFEFLGRTIYYKMHIFFQKGVDINFGIEHKTCCFVYVCFVFVLLCLFFVFVFVCFCFALFCFVFARGAVPP